MWFMYHPWNTQKLPHSAHHGDFYAYGKLKCYISYDNYHDMNKDSLVTS